MCTTHTIGFCRVHMSKINIWRRPYKSGRPIDNDLKGLIILALEEFGCVVSSGYYPRGAFTHVSVKYKVTRHTVKKIWLRHCFEDVAQSVRPIGRPSGTGRLLTPQDEHYVAQLVSMRPTIFRREIKDLLLRYSNTLSPNSSLSESTISRTIKHRIGPKGKKVTRKKVTVSNEARWPWDNIVYTANFTNYIGSLNPYTVCFVDESHFQFENCQRKYGSSLSGSKCLSIQKQPTGICCSLILLITLRGDHYAECIEGTVNSFDFVRFMSNALDARAHDGQFIVKPSYTICLDNATLHKGQSLQLLRPLLHRRVVDYVYLPPYSPDLSAVEFAFGHIKQTLKQEPFKTYVNLDLKLAIKRCCAQLTSSLMYSFYKSVTDNYMHLI